MADQESTGNSAATSSPTPLINWWDLHATSLSSWTNNTNNNVWNNQPNPDSNSSSCEDQDISVSTSFTNASGSNHSSLTVESPRPLVELSGASSNSFMGEHASDNHLWSHLLLGTVGRNDELQKSQVGENFLNALSLKTMTNKPSWEYNNISSCTTTTSFNGFEKHLNGFSDAIQLESQRLNKLSSLVTTWSIAPPDPEVNNNTQFDPQTNNNVTLNSSIMDHSGISPCYVLDMNVKQEHHHGAASGVPGALFGRSCDNSTVGYQSGPFNNPAPACVGLGDNNNGKFYYGMPSFNSSCTRNLTDVISFTGRLGRPVIGIHALKPTLKSSNILDSKKQRFQTSSPSRTTNNGRGQGSATEVKKKRSEDCSEAILKKPKQETSTASSTKVQAPKAKLGDKITTLQQIVSPFGKTDTASVLFEAIGHIEFLQEQIQLLSNSYMKTNSHKDTWCSLDRKDKGDANVDLRSRGLCLVPVSCTPQVYRENTGPDYWTPAYRGCLYR